MNKEKYVIIFLIFLSTLNFYLGYQSAVNEKKQVYDSMSFLLFSDRNLETYGNIKILELLKINNIDGTIDFIQKKVGVSLKQEGISEKTIKKAKDYQAKHCANACLGVKN